MIYCSCGRTWGEAERRAGCEDDVCKQLMMIVVMSRTHTAACGCAAACVYSNSSELFTINFANSSAATACLGVFAFSFPHEEKLFFRGESKEHGTLSTYHCMYISSLL